MAIVAVSQVGPLLQATATLDDITVSGATLGGVLMVSQHSVFVPRYVRLDGDKNTVAAAMIALGFSAYSNEVQAAIRFFSRRVPPTYILLGRRSPADISWPVAMAAIKIALDLARETVVHVGYAGRVEVDQRAISLYCNSVGWLPHMSTPSLAVRNNALGSLEKLMQVDGTLCNLIAYDPATESGAAAPTVITAAAPFDLSSTDLTALTVTLAMAVQQNAAAAETVTFTASRAERTTTNTGPYNLEPAQILSVGFDGLGPWPVALDATAAMMTSIVGPYSLVAGQIVEIIVNNTAYTYAVAALNYVNILAATAIEIAAEAMLLAPLAAVITLANNAGAVRGTTVRRGTGASWQIGSGTAGAWAAALGFIAAGVSGDGNVSNIDAVTSTELATLTAVASGLLFASNVGGKLRWRSLKFGTAGVVTIGAATSAPVLAALGIVVGSTFGSGSASNAAITTGAELEALTNAGLAGPIVALENNATRITGTLGIGALHTLYLVGPLADALKIAGTYTGNGIADDWAEFSWLGSRAGLSLDAAPPDAGHLTWNNVSVLGAYGTRTLSIPEMKRLNREQNVNTFCLINPARGPEFHDGRLTIPFASGAPTYVDQWIATHWIASYMAQVFSTRINAISDGNDQLGYWSEAAYGPEIIGWVLEAQSVAVRSRCLAYVDTSAPSASKPTGVIVTPKAQLAPSTKQLRLGEVRVWCKLSSALHGLLTQVVLFV